MVMPIRDARYSFLRSDGAPPLDQNRYTFRLIRDAVETTEAPHLVPILYRNLKPPPTVVREQYRTLFNLGRNRSRGRSFPGSRADQTDDSDLDISTDARAEGLVIRNYTGTGVATVHGGRGAGPLSKDQR